MELIVIVLMLAVNAVFAAYEMALASVTRARLEVLLKANRRGARSAAYMKDRLEASLAVIQLGITLAGAIAAAAGGAGADEWLSPRISQTLGVSAGTSEFLALLLFVIPLSAVTIVFAELVPKMIGIHNKEEVALTLSPAMVVVSRIFRPVVFVFETLVKHLVRVRHGGTAEDRATEDRAGLLELRAAASLARATRVIGPLEERIVVSAAQLSARTVADAMVPAKDIAAIPAGATLSDALVVAHTHMHTRYPVCNEADNPQSIVGYVTFKDIIAAMKIAPASHGISGIVRPLAKIDAKTTLAKALTDIISEHIHIALISDGERVLGMLTMEDIVEELVGDLHDEYEHLPAHIHPIGDGWIAGGGALIESLKTTVGGDGFADADGKLTLADWADRVRENSPRSGDTIRKDGVEVLVRKIRRNRVAEAVVRKAQTV